MMKHPHQAPGPDGPQAAVPHGIHPPKSHGCTGSGPSPASAGGHYPVPQHALAPEDGRYYQYNQDQYGYQDYGLEAPAYNAEGLRSWFEFSNSCYLKGFLIGAGAALLITNSSVQKSLVRGTVRVWSFFQGGVEEVKEQFRDVQAELSQEK